MLRHRLRENAFTHTLHLQSSVGLCDYLVILVCGAWVV